VGVCSRELEVIVEELKVKLSDKDQEMKLACEKSHQETDELQKKLDQLQLNNDRVVEEKSALAEKVLSVCWALF